MIKKALSDGTELVIEIRVPEGENVFDAVRSALKEMDESEASFRGNVPDPEECCGCTPCTYWMTFGEAMEELKRGARVMREGWNGKGMHLSVQFPDEHSKMTFPYLYMTIPDCAEGIRKLPWQPAQVDLFSEDWVILD